MKIKGIGYDFNQKMEGMLQLINTHFPVDGTAFARSDCEIVASIPYYGSFDIVGHFDRITQCCAGARELPRHGNRCRKESEMKTILFQGDSITDTLHAEEYICAMGYGYAGYVAARLGLESPNAYRFINRGVGGNRITDLYARIKNDIINIKPDVLSILIGVNDAWHEFLNQNGVSTDKFVKIYKMLLDEVKEALPATMIILMEPFVLKSEGIAEYFEVFQKNVFEKARVVRQIAQEYGLPFVELQSDLDRLVQKAPNEYWLLDGVHPTIYFHQYIADKWIDTYKNVK